MCVGARVLALADKAKHKWKEATITAIRKEPLLYAVRFDSGHSASEDEEAADKAIYSDDNFAEAEPYVASHISDHQTDEDEYDCDDLLSLNEIEDAESGKATKRKKGSYISKKSSGGRSRPAKRTSLDESCRKKRRHGNEGGFLRISEDSFKNGIYTVFRCFYFRFK